MPTKHLISCSVPKKQRRGNSGSDSLTAQEGETAMAGILGVLLKKVVEAREGVCPRPQGWGGGCH